MRYKCDLYQNILKTYSKFDPTDSKTKLNSVIDNSNKKNSF